MPSSGPSNAPLSTFRILQLNLAGVRSRHVELLKFLQDEQIDVACVQETNLGGGVEPPRLSGWQLVGRKDRRVNAMFLRSGRSMVGTSASIPIFSQQQQPLSS